MPFDPDKFLAEETAATPPTDSNQVDTTVMPEPLQPKSEQFDPDKFLSEETYGTPGQMAQTFGEAFARGAISQPLATATEVAGGTPREDILGRQKENPWTNFFGELTGFGVGAYTGTGEAAVLGKIGEAVNGAGKIGAPVIKGLIDGLALSGGDEVSKKILQDPDQTAGSVIAHVGLGTLFSGALGTVGGLWSAGKSDGVEAALNAIKSDSEAVGGSLVPQPTDPKINPLMKTALSVALGPSPEMIDARIANLESIRTAPEFQDVYDHVLDHINNVGMEAADQQKILEDSIKEFERSGYEAKDADRAAKAALKDAQTQIFSDLQRDAFSKAPVIADAYSSLNNRAILEAQVAREMLTKTNKQISLQPFYDAIKDLQDKVASTASPLGFKQAEELGKYAESVGAMYGTKTDAPMLKSVMDGLDTLSDWQKAPGELGKSLTPEYRQLRRVLDDTLKGSGGVPGYADAMKPASDKFKFLDNLDAYSTPEGAVNKIASLKNTKNFINEMPLLQELEDRSGFKFAQILHQYASPALRENLIANHPAVAEAERAAKALAALQHPDARPAFEHSIMTEPDWLEAMEAKNNIKGLTENNLQTKMNSVMTGKNIAARNLMEKLPGMEGMSIPEILDLIAVRQAFEKGAGMGSRNVNLFGGIGGTLGGLGGGLIGGLPGASIGAGVGGSAGAMLGSVIDRKGPAIAAKLLDKYMEEIPSNAGLSQRMIRGGLKAMLGSEAEPSGTGFKAAADYSENAAKGFKATKEAAKAVFKKGLSVVPSQLVPEDRQLNDLDDRLKEIHKKPVEHLAFGGEVGHYMPKHVEALARVGKTASDLLNAARPEIKQNSPLDPKMEPSQAAKNNYMKTLEVAQQPLMLMKHLKEGTLIPQHINTVKTIYPKFYDQMNQELTDAMVDHLNEGNNVPYHIKQGLTALMGQPMDSTMTPASAQSIIMSAGPQQMAQQAAKSKDKKASGAELSQINKVNSQYLTALQAREADKKE